MSNSSVIETVLVITQKGKDSKKWTWLHLGGWSKGLKNRNENRFLSEDLIRSYGLRASKADLDKATLDGFFELKTINRVYSCM